MYDDKKTENENEGFGFYLNHEGIKFGYGLGNGVHIDIIKSRTNQTGRTLHMVFDKVHGVDSVRSSLIYAKECGLITGNKNSSYFNSNKDVKFSVKNAPTEFRNRPELYKIMYDNLIPALNEVLSDVTDEEDTYDTNLLDY